MYAVKVISLLRLFIRKETIKMHHVRTFFFFFWKCHEENYRYKKQTNKLLFSFQLTLKGMSKRQSSRRGSLESYFTVQILFPGVLVMLYVAIANLSHPISTDNAENGKLTVFSPDFNSAPVCCIYCFCFFFFIFFVFAVASYFPHWALCHNWFLFFNSFLVFLSSQTEVCLKIMPFPITSQIFR